MYAKLLRQNSVAFRSATARPFIERTATLGLFLLFLALSSSSAAEPTIDYARDVRPILSKHCFKCHGPDDEKREAKLRLDLREAALLKAESGETPIVPGKPAASEVISRVTSDDADLQMPPAAAKMPLTDAQKEILRRWIAEGAEYKPHWAFIAPKPQPLPTVKQRDWPRNAIDYFILARMEKEQLAPSPAADKHTLVRRVYLDLVGLPPSPDEAAAFVIDKSPDAYEKLVDRLLASPQYGERWARRWLDLARYADTNGYEKDRQRSIWPYRDWVIRALNRDLPFDQFTIEQLAGDMLPQANLDQRVATGFHRNTMLNEEGGIDPLEFRFYAVVDRTNTTATTWLGLTLGCAQCHTHKFDPIPHREYYSMLAYLNNADEPELAVPTPTMDARRKELLQKIATLEAELPSKFATDENLTWQTMKPDRAASAGKATTEILDDQSVRIGGENPAEDTLTLEFTSDSHEAIGGLRVEAVADPKAAAPGPGRTPHGNFVLTELKVETISAEGKAEAVKLVSATADFQQNTFPPANCFDGDPKTGWAIHGPGKWNVTRAASFVFDKPRQSDGPTKWRVTLAQTYGTQHTLARVRLRLGTRPANFEPKQARQEKFQAAFKAWQTEAREKLVKWTVLTPTSAKSAIPHLTIEPDSSVLASGDQSKSDLYELAFDQQLTAITAIRLEALADERLPKGGPGRIYYEGPPGDFFLSKIGANADGAPLKFAKATNTFASGGNTADKAIDNDLQSGWSINGKQGESHTAIFVLDKPLAKPSKLDVQLLFERYYAAGMGRLRISITDDPRATEGLSLPPDIQRILLSNDKQLSVGDATKLEQYFVSTTPALAGARAQIEQLRKQLPDPPTTLAMSERPRENPRVTQRMHRGEFLQPKEDVPPGTLSALGLPSNMPRDRLAFAKWLASGDNPLTARVMVNRQWAAIFGRGIVRTTEDFGLQSEVPSHPELLDWLAMELVRDGWSIKRLHRLIVTSNTYRQSSRVSDALLAHDPQNVLLARGPRVRLEAELVRDYALAVSGLLSRKQGGPSVFPPQPPGVSTEGAYGSLAWNVSPGEDRYRRGLYTFAKRTAPFAMTSTFDGPTGEACIPRREVSNTPLQALVLLNDAAFVEAAQALGRTAAADSGSDQQRVERLFARVLVRDPSQSETEKIVAYVQAQRARLENKELDAVALAGTGANAPERAAWTLVARALLNLDEVVMKE